MTDTAAADLRARARRVARGRPRPHHPRRACGAARRRRPRARWQTASPAGCISARPACADRCGPARPDEPRRRAPRRRRSRRLPARPLGLGPGRHRLRRPARQCRLRPRHGRRPRRRRPGRTPAPPGAADAGARLRGPRARRRRRRDGHRQPQPAAGQRLQGLPRRRLADGPAARGRRSCRRPTPRSRPRSTPSDRLAERPAGRRLDPARRRVVENYLRAVAALSRTAGPRDVAIAYTPLHGVGGDVALAAFAPGRLCRPGRRGRAGRPRSRLPDRARSRTPRSRARSTGRWPSPRGSGADLVIANDPDADRCAVA